jgi:Rieske Fe-S protein
MQERLKSLETWARRYFPAMEEVVYSWSGQVMESNDGLAYIGHNPHDQDNIFIITGDSGVGLTHGTIGGMLITDLIIGRANPWTSLYDPTRINLRAAKEFTKEALNMAGQYADWITPGDVASVDQIKRDSGALLRDGLKKIAVYRDEKGHLHRFSAVCPHLGCIVQWNDLEKTWDCPCHGSRFKSTGTVLNGPANVNLAKVSD